MNVGLLHDKDGFGYINATNIGTVPRVKEAGISARMHSLVVYNSSNKRVLDSIGMAKKTFAVKTVGGARKLRHKLNAQFEDLKQVPLSAPIARVETRWIGKNATQIKALMSFSTGAVVYDDAGLIGQMDVYHRVVAHDEYIRGVNVYIKLMNDAKCGFGFGNNNNNSEPLVTRSKFADVLNAFGRGANIKQASFIDKKITWNPERRNATKRQIAKSKTRFNTTILFEKYASGVHCDSPAAIIERNDNANMPWYLSPEAPFTHAQRVALANETPLMRLLLNVLRRSRGKQKYEVRNNQGHVAFTANSKKEVYKKTFCWFGPRWLQQASTKKWTALRTDEWRQLKTIYGEENKILFKIHFSKRHKNLSDLKL